MRQSYRDLYGLFRRNPRAEEYFNALPFYVQDQLRAQYRTVDSLANLRAYAARLQAHDTPELLEMTGGAACGRPPVSR